MRGCHIRPRPCRALPHPQPKAAPARIPLIARLTSPSPTAICPVLSSKTASSASCIRRLRAPLAKVFDSTAEHDRPFEFRYGGGQVIPGFELGMRGMRVGGRRRMTIPPELGYGSRSAGERIPPNSTLVFEVELVGVRAAD